MTAGLERDEQLALQRAKLRYVLRTPLRRYRLDDRIAAGMGRAYSDEAIDSVEVLHALAQCTRRQQLARALCLGHGLGGGEAAGVLGVSRSTVNWAILEAMERMRAQVWEDA